MQELASAVNAGVEIVLITKEGSRWPNSNGDMVEVFPPPELIEALEPPECRAAFSRRAITHTNEYYAAFSHNLMQTVESMIAQHRQQHGSPANGQETPDRLVVAQRRQLLLARSQSSLGKGRRGSASGAELALATLESSVTSPVTLLDADGLEAAIRAARNEPDLDPNVLAAATAQLQRARAHTKLTPEEKRLAAREGTACEFCFLRAAVLLDRNDASLPPHRGISEDPELYALLYLTSAECCQHMYRHKILIVSHRWDRPNEPDPSGEQMKALKRILRAHPQYEYVWVVRAPPIGAPLL